LPNGAASPCARHRFSNPPGGDIVCKSDSESFRRARLPSVSEDAVLRLNSISAATNFSEPLVELTKPEAGVERPLRRHCVDPYEVHLAAQVTLFKK
jgi:hypothetical protein